MMYSAPFGSRPLNPRNFAGAYQQVGAQTAVSNASAHELVSLLFEAYFTALLRAEGAIRNKDVPTKNAALCHALRIVDEGLKSALNLNAGGRLAADLADLYAYICLRLTQANLKSDTQALEECRRLMQPLREAWNSIAEHQEVLNRI